MASDETILTAAQVDRIWREDHIQASTISPEFYRVLVDRESLRAALAERTRERDELLERAEAVLTAHGLTGPTEE